MARMRPRTPVTPEQIVAALDFSQGDIEAAAAQLRTKGVEVSGRTLRRRMAEFGIKARVSYEAEQAEAVA
jgi:translation elongation factor EF-Ts